MAEAEGVRVASIESIRDLELFQLVVELGSFTEAAFAAGVSQPAVSLAIKRLETRLGAALLDRQRFGAGGGLSVTPAGAILVQHTAAILEEINSVSRKIDELAEPDVYRVGLPPIVSAYLLGSLTIETLAARVGADLSVSSVGSQRLLAEIEQHRIDFGAIATAGRAPHIGGIETVKVASFPFLLAVSASHVLSASGSMSFDIVARQPGLRFVTLSRDFVHSQAAGSFLRERIAASRIIEVADIGAMKTVIASGIAVGLVASVAVTNDPRFHLIPLTQTDLPTFDVYLFNDVSRDAPSSHDAGVQAFIELVGENIGTPEVGSSPLGRVPPGIGGES